MGRIYGQASRTRLSRSRSGLHRALRRAVNVCTTERGFARFARAQHLQRGINATQRFSNWSRDYSVDRLETYTTADDIALMAAFGFDHVRLGIDVDPLALWLTSNQWGGGPRLL
jgi:hypothetical protein